MSPDEFLTKFHSIDGITLAERRKSFNKLLDDLQSGSSNPQTEEEIKSYAQKIAPRTSLEQTFKVDFLIRFRCFDELVEILKGENLALIRRVIKQKWFFQQEFSRRVSRLRLTQEILGKTSYNTGKLILSKLANHFQEEEDVEKQSPDDLETNEGQADRYFDAVKRCYGIFTAQILLPCCSLEKILDTIFMNGNKLSDKYVLRSLKKDPNFLSLYYSASKRHNNFYFHEYEKSLRYLAVNHVDIFYELYSRHGFNVQLNRKGTVALFKKCRKEIIEKPKAFIGMLDMSYVQRNLKEDFKEFLSNLFPKNIKDFSLWGCESYAIRNCKVNDKHWDENTAIYSSLLPYSREDKFRLLSETFTKKYDCNILDYSQFVTEGVMKLLPAEQLRLCVDKYGKLGEDEWRRFLPVSESIPYYKNKLNLTSDVSKRGELLARLVETCSFNGKDPVALLEVLHYVIKRHRNDVVANRSRFMESVKDNFELELLSNEHWIAIRQMLQLFKLNREDFYPIKEFLIKYIHFSLVKDLPIKVHLIELVQQMGRYNCSYNIFRDIPEYEKKCLTIVGFAIPEVLTGEDLEAAQFGYLESLLDWNERHPKDVFLLTFYPAYVQALKKMLTSEEKATYSAVSVLNKLLRSKEYSDTFDLYPFFWKHNTSHGIEPYPIIWKILKNDPIMLIMNIESLANSDYINKIWPALLLFEHLQLPQAVILHCVTQLHDNSDEDNSGGNNSGGNNSGGDNSGGNNPDGNNPDGDNPDGDNSGGNNPDGNNSAENNQDGNNQGGNNSGENNSGGNNSSEKKRKHINKRPLILALSYLLPATDFINTIAKFLPSKEKIAQDESSNKYHLQHTIIQSLRYASPPSLTLETVLRFCAGDYLSISLSTLYTTVQYLPRPLLQLLFETIMSRAVSVRKHAIFLTCNVSNLEEINALLREAGSTEKNASLRKFIIKNTVRHFIRNPSEETWGLLTANGGIMDSDDEEAYHFLFDYKKIPVDYIPRFIEYSWGVWETAKEDFRHKRYELIRSLPREVISSLEIDFCLGVIQKTFLTKCHVEHDVLSFCYKYIRAAATYRDMQFRIGQIFQICADYKTTQWEDVHSGMRCRLQDFIEVFCSEAIEEYSYQNLQKGGETSKGDTPAKDKVFTEVTGDRVLSQVAESFYKVFKIPEVFDEHLRLQLSIIYLEISSIESLEKWKYFAPKLTKFLRKTVEEYGLEVLPIVCKMIEEVLCQVDCRDEEERFVLIHALMECNVNEPMSNNAWALLVLHLLPEKLPMAKSYLEKHLSILEVFKRNPKVGISIALNRHLKQLAEQ